MKEQKGFTLIEVVLAIGIMSLVIGTAYSSLSNLLQSKRVLDDQREITLMANAVLSRLTRELQLVSTSASLLKPADPGAAAFGREVHLIGEPVSLGGGRRGDRITFVALEAGQYMPDGLTHSGIVQIGYRVEPDPEAADDPQAPFYLIRDETPVFHGRENPYEQTMTFPVSRNVISLAFRYYDQQEFKWSTDWPQEKRRVPGMIAFTLRMKSPGGEIHSFSTTVPLQEAGDGS